MNFETVLRRRLFERFEHFQRTNLDQRLHYVTCLSCCRYNVTDALPRAVAKE